MSGDFRAGERAMRTLLIVQRAQKRDAHFLMSEVVPLVRDELKINRASAFRLIRMAIDVLCISYEGDEIRNDRRGDAISNSWTDRRAA
jgi:hypothetical protein